MDMREKAIGALKREIGTDFGYGTVTTDSGREYCLRIARRYPDNLERALKEELPKKKEKLPKKKEVKAEEKAEELEKTDDNESKEA